MKRFFIGVSAILFLFLFSILTFAATSEVETQASISLNPTILIGVALILVFAKLGGELFERIGQPAVLGELVAGIVIGNLALFGFGGVEFLKNNEVIASLAEIGVIILLFEVGLESNVKDMAKVGWSSLLVAIVGVIAPFFLGWAVAAYFLPNASILSHIFIGATLCATSVGITARVFKDLNVLGTKESRIVLGAAVIDDVLGLLILAVIGGAIKAAQTGAAIGSLEIIFIALKAFTFLFGAIAAGHYIVPHIFRYAGFLQHRGVLLALAFSFCFLLSWIATWVGLAPIVGAFAAGLVLEEAHFKNFKDREELRLEQLIAPVSTILVPIFFVLMGMRVDLSLFAKPELLFFAAALTLAAIIGKQVCSFATIEKNINRAAIGLGMIPRGEVGLILAGIGMTLTLPNAGGTSEPVIDSATFGAVVLMVIATTLVTPPLLNWILNNKSSEEQTRHSQIINKIVPEAAD